jgi:hypothetical protein
MVSNSHRRPRRADWKGARMVDALRHPDVLNDQEAVAYLRLDAAADTPEAALRLLHRLAGDGRLHPIRWAKKHLWAKPDLDRFVAHELAALDVHSDTETDGNPTPSTRNRLISANGHKRGHKGAKE